MMTAENGCTECCGQEPTLRVRPKEVGLTRPEVVPYVQYECRICQRKGGLVVTEQSAAKLWEDWS